MPTVLITGANRGLGLEFVRQYSGEGWRVYAATRRPDSAAELRRIAQTNGGRTRILALDVTEMASVRRAAEEVGPEPIDILVNNAGIDGKPKQRIGNIDYAAWAEVLNVNTMGPMRVTGTFCDNVARSDRKLIVTITSGMGSLADNTSGGSIPYRTSKAAVNMVMRSNAIDLAPLGITCILVNPGWVRTDMGGPNARLTPEQSISSLRALFERMRQEHTGKFFNHDGSIYPW